MHCSLDKTGVSYWFKELHIWIATYGIIILKMCILLTLMEYCYYIPLDNYAVQTKALFNGYFDWGRGLGFIVVF